MSSARPFRHASRDWRSSSSRSEEHTSELQSRLHLVCRLLLEKKKKTYSKHSTSYRSYEEESYYPLQTSVPSLYHMDIRSAHGSTSRPGAEGEPTGTTIPIHLH